MRCTIHSSLVSRIVSRLLIIYSVLRAGIPAPHITSIFLISDHSDIPVFFIAAAQAEHVRLGLHAARVQRSLDTLSRSRSQTASRSISLRTAAASGSSDDPHRGSPASSIQVLCRQLHDLGRLLGPAAVFPQDAGKALRGKDRSRPHSPA